MPALEYLRKETTILTRLLEPKVRVIMVIGGPDTGKTAFVESLSGFLSERASTAILDLDMGQSHIGPPTTIAWGKVEGGFKGWDRVKAEDFYFTGALSPPGNLVPSIVGAKRVLDLALPECEKLVIDTTGLIAGALGRLFKLYKIELLSPDIIIGLERDAELGHILDPLKFDKRPVVRLKVDEAVSYKSPDIRAEHRAEMFRGYFLNSGTIEVNLSKAGVRYTRGDEGGDLTGRIVSLRSGDKDLALGAVERHEIKKNSLLIRTPLKKGAKFTTVIIGEAAIPPGII
ncbi:MAG: Clp1/GlmU family protein [Deltaproteobacteria bacterium]|nr:Clp1/GlmU family protein [Deltaproteobacteria bacterium]